MVESSLVEGKSWGEKFSLLSVLISQIAFANVIYTYIQSGKGNKIMQLYLSLDETQPPDYRKV